MRNLYLEGLKDLLSAENQLVKALPKMAKAATSKDLRACFEGHLEQTKEHVARLEKIFDSTGESPKGKRCQGIAGLIKKTSAMIEEAPGPDELDAGLISIAQRVEHYEIARYGGVSTYAKRLKEDKAVSLLRQTLREEIEIHKKLSQLEDRVNLKAVNSRESDGGRGSEPIQQADLVERKKGSQQ